MDLVVVLFTSSEQRNETDGIAGRITRSTAHQPLILKYFLTAMGIRRCL